MPKWPFIATNVPSCAEERCKSALFPLLIQPQTVWVSKVALVVSPCYLASTWPSRQAHHGRERATEIPRTSFGHLPETAQ